MTSDRPSWLADRRKSGGKVRRWAGALLLASAAAGGCGPAPAERAGDEAARLYFAGDYARAAAVLEPEAQKTDENFALQNARLGSVYLAGQRLDDAEAAFLKAYEVMNSVGTNSGGRTLGAVLIDEKLRVWKGEPFERAMANFYLGTVYYLRGDYNNARAAYENALFRLRDYDDAADKASGDRLESNFALATIMLGRCWQKLGRDDLAGAAFAKAAQLQPYLAGLADPEVHRRANVLLLADYGYGPRRVTEFDGSALVFTPTPGQVGPVPQPRVLVDGQAYDLRNTDVPPVDLLALAQDRKWQSIDTIRVAKSAAGTGLLGAGAIMGLKGLGEGGSRQRTDLAVAAGLLAGGLLLKATSQADVREWGLLPRVTFVLPMSLPPGRHEITVELADGTRQTWQGLEAPASGERAYYLRLQRFVQGPYGWPGSP